MSAKGTRRTLDSLLASFLLVGVAVFYLGLNSGTWLISPDSTDYVEGARGLASLRGYVDAQGDAITFFPPGTSALYALAALIPSQDYRYFNLLSKLAVLAFVGLSFLVVRRSAGTPVALLVALFLALSQSVIHASTRILSDPVFGALLVLTVWCFPSERLDALSARSALGLGLMLGILCAVRTIGSAVFAAYVTGLYLRGGRRDRARNLVLVALGFVVIAAPLVLRSAGGKDSYFRMLFWREMWVADSGVPGLLDWYVRIATNLGRLGRDVYYLASNQWEWTPSGVAVCALIVLGCVAAFARRRVSLEVWIAGFYGVALLGWTSEARLVMPMAPILALLAVDGARWVMTWSTGAPWARGVVAVLLALAVSVGPYWREGLLYADTMRTSLERHRGEAIAWERHDAFVDLVRRHAARLGPSDVVATMHPNVVRYFLPGEVALRPIGLFRDPEKAYRAIQDQGVTYLYCDKVDSSTWAYVEPMARRYGSDLEVVTEDDSAVIYRVRRAPRPTSAQDDATASEK